MISLQRGMRKWEPLIKRSTHCTSIEYTIRDTGDFTITVKWPGGQHDKLFKREEVFPHVRPGVQLRTKKRVCMYADEVIMEVLRARGV